jgi:hypothetical protein
VTFIDIGQGDCALLELPGGARLLLDAGPPAHPISRVSFSNQSSAPGAWRRWTLRSLRTPTRITSADFPRCLM